MAKVVVPGDENEDGEVEWDTVSLKSIAKGMTIMHSYQFGGN